MDVLVLIEDCGDDAPARPVPTGRADGTQPVAYVHWVPTEADQVAFRSAGTAVGREVITLCGDPDAGRLAVALAAALEARRSMPTNAPGAVRHLGVWDGAGASGDVAWRDHDTGQLLSRDLSIAAAAVDVTAARLIAECGAAIRQTTAKLAMPDWPEGVRRAISFRLVVPADLLPDAPALVGIAGDGLLASLREADGYDDEGY